MKTRGLYMNKTAKIIVTIIVILAFFFLFALVNIVGKQVSGARTPGMLGVILFAAVFGAIKAIWKSEKSKKQDKNNDGPSSILQ